MCTRHCEARGCQGAFERVDSTVCTFRSTDNSHLCRHGGAQKVEWLGSPLIPVLMSSDTRLVGTAICFVMLLL